MNSNAPGFD